MTEKEKYQIEAMKSIGIDTEGKTYNECVEILIHEHISLMMEIEMDNKEYFKKELKRIATQRTN